MLKIAITLPMVISGEVAIIRRLLADGFDVIHLRKPEADINYCRALLSELKPIQRARIVVHDHAALYHEFGLRGIHLNKNISALPTGYSGSRTRSCHSFEEVTMYKDECDYLFLSPIFDRISKQGYRSAFSHEELTWASQRGIIDSKVIALGGVTQQDMKYLEALGFGGVAMSGAIYKHE